MKSKRVEPLSHPAPLDHAIRKTSACDCGRLCSLQLAATKRGAVFNGDLRWKELYPKAEVTGKGKVGSRDCWIVKLSPAEGQPVTRYYDTDTFLLARTVSTGEAGETQADRSDYRDVGNGVRIANTMKLTVPNIGELVIRSKEFKPDAEIDDARFAKPKQ